MTEALIVADGLHPPWNKGEAVTARNFVNILATLYKKIHVISNVEESRAPKSIMTTGVSLGPEDLHFLPSNSELIYWSKHDRNNLIKTQIRKKNYHLHLLHIIDYSPFSLILRKNTFLYNYSYKTFGIPTLRLYAMPLLASASRFVCLTTCIKDYKNLSKYIKRNYVYVPAPICSGGEPRESKEKHDSDSPLKLLYIGHPTYRRFPYIELFRALLRLSETKSNLILDVYFSKVKGRYFDYESFMKGLESTLEQFGLNDIVRIHVQNLTEEQKRQVLLESDVLIYPAMSDVAMDPPIVVLEAMSAGCCVVATRVQSCELLLNSERGLLVSKDEIETGIIDSLNRLIRDRSLVEHYGLRAKAYVNTFHSLATSRKVLKDVIGL